MFDVCYSLSNLFKCLLYLMILVSHNFRLFVFVCAFLRSCIAVTLFIVVVSILLGVKQCGVCC